MTYILHNIASQIYDGEADEVAVLVQQALDRGMGPQEVLSGGLVAGMTRLAVTSRPGSCSSQRCLLRPGHARRHEHSATTASRERRA